MQHYPGTKYTAARQAILGVPGFKIRVPREGFTIEGAFDIDARMMDLDIAVENLSDLVEDNEYGSRC